MANVHLFPIIFVLLVSSTIGEGEAYIIFSSKQLKNWLVRQGLSKETVTHLHFYFHDRVGGKNATTALVAAAPIATKSPTGFGQLVMADDPLTELPNPNFDKVGRVQGGYGTFGREEATLIMAFSFFFSKGEFTGSSLSMISRNLISRWD